LGHKAFPVWSWVRAQRDSHLSPFTVVVS
jgi:hypothetical protein